LAVLGMHLEVEVGRPAPGIAGVADVADHLAGLDPAGAAEGFHVSPDVGDAVDPTEIELEATHRSRDQLDLAADRRQHLGAAGGHEVGSLVEALARTGKAP